MCHLALLLPLLTLPVFWLWPLDVALPVYLVALALSAAVYYLAFAAMRQPVLNGPEHLLGCRTKVTECTDDHAYVRLDSERWQVEATDALAVGDEVEVVGIEGARLLVKRMTAAADAAHAQR